VAAVDDPSRIRQSRDVGGLFGLAGALCGPFVVLLHQDRADEADYGVVLAKDANDIGPPLDRNIKV
jgi:hypothetical protein